MVLQQHAALLLQRRLERGPENMPSIPGRSTFRCTLVSWTSMVRIDRFAHRRDLEVELVAGPARLYARRAGDMVLQACGCCWRSGVGPRPCRGCAAGRCRWAKSLLRCRRCSALFKLRCASMHHVMREFLRGPRRACLHPPQRRPSPAVPPTPKLHRGLRRLGSGWGLTSPLGKTSRAIAPGTSPTRCMPHR